MTDTRPIAVNGSDMNRMKCVQNGVKILYGVDTLQSGDLYEDEETGQQVVKGFGNKYTVEGESRQNRIEKAVRRADFIPERVRESLDTMGVDY